MRVEKIYMDGVTVEVAVEHCGVRHYGKSAAELEPFAMRERGADSYSQEEVEIACSVCRRDLTAIITNDLEGVQLDCGDIPREGIFFRIAGEPQPFNEDPYVYLEEQEDDEVQERPEPDGEPDHAP